MNKLVICKNCGWVHFPVSQEYIDESNLQWMLHMKDLDQKVVDDCYGGSRECHNYEECTRCSGSYKNFRNLRKSDHFGDGHTISPIKHFKEK